MPSYGVFTEEALSLRDAVPPNNVVSGGPRLVRFDPPALRFPAQDLGNSVILGVRVTARGAAVLLGDLSIAGDNASDFSVESFDLPSPSVSLGGGYTARVTFTPATEELRTATLLVPHGRRGQAYSIPLTGRGNPTAGGAPIWATGTGGGPDPGYSNVLASGEYVKPGELVVHNTSGFTVAFQTDGNLVVYNDWVADRPHVLWASNTDRMRATVLWMQLDGNLVIYRDRTPLWASGTNGHSGARLILQNDGNLVIIA